MNTVFDYTNGSESIKQMFEYDIQNMFYTKNNKEIVYWKTKKEPGIEEYIKINYKNEEAHTIYKYLITSYKKYFDVFYPDSPSFKIGRLCPITDKLEVLQIQSIIYKHFLIVSKSV